MCGFVCLCMWTPAQSNDTLSTKECIILVEHLPSNGLPEVALAVKNPPANTKDMRLGFDPRIRKIPWRKAWQPTPVFLLQNPMDRGDCWATVHRITQSQTRLKWLSTHAPLSNIKVGIKSRKLKLWFTGWFMIFFVKQYFMLLCVSFPFLPSPN